MKFVAFERTLQGTGASRRLRIAAKVPGIVYGAGTPAMIELDHNALFFALKKEAFHSSILEMELAGKSEQVLLRDYQMHPFRPIVLHIDFQRVDATTKITKRVPLHFINEENSPAVKTDACVVNHVVTELLIQCLASQLPEFLTVDLGSLAKGQSLHVDDIALGEGVKVMTQGKKNPVIVSVSAQAAEEEIIAAPVVAAVAPGKVIRFGSDTVAGAPGQGAYRELYVLDSRPIITGEYLTNAKPNNNQLEGGFIVEFEFNAEGGRIFRRETGKHVRDNMAVVLDDRVVTAPTINSAIGRNGQITLGGGSLQDAQDLALVLRAGALPVPLKVAEIRNIGASLGQDSIDKGKLAFGIAIMLVVIIMVGYYRFSGAVACAALALYIFFTLAVLAGFGAALGYLGGQQCGVGGNQRAYAASLFSQQHQPGQQLHRTGSRLFR